MQPREIAVDITDDVVELDEPIVYWIDGSRLYKGMLVPIPKQFLALPELPPVHENISLTRFTPDSAWSVQRVLDIHGLSSPFYLVNEHGGDILLGYIKQKEDITDNVLELFLATKVDTIDETASKGEIFLG
jgi:hypothetical protein